MVRRILYDIGMIILLGIISISCQSLSESNVVPEVYSAVLFRPTSVYFLDTIPYPATNPFSEEGIALGEKLFFDPILSSNQKVSCATCHEPSLLFSDGISLSTDGVSGKVLKRHAPALINLAWYDGFFWEGGAKNLESLMFGPLMHPDEMDADLDVIVTRLKGDEAYSSAFKRAFATDVKSALIAKALAQFVRTLVHDTSKYDLVANGKSSFTELELKGKALFKLGCAECHTPPFFTDFSYRNNGLDSTFSKSDEGLAQGRFRISLDSSDMGAYKVPTLRGVSHTSPYMHDGRFATLAEVLEHYNHSIIRGSATDKFLNKPLMLSKEDKIALEAFLRTL